jgi:hypothetical protein
MPLIHDAEYIEALLGVKENFKNENYMYFRYIMPISHVLLAGLVAWVLPMFGVANTVAAIMGACMAIVSAIAWLTYEIRFQFVVSIAVTEWVGRKQLGEYQKP